MKIYPWISAALVAALFVSGPLAPMAAFAQAPQPGQEREPVNPEEKMLMPSVEPITGKDPTVGDAIGAGFMNVVYVPGKVIVCTAGVLTSTVLMLVTLGSSYRAARSVFLEGCSAPWALTGRYVSGKIPGPGDPGYDPTGSY
jgi:hypothetical protein